MIQKSGVDVAIFASGAGTNAEKIIEYFRSSVLINISLIVCNKPAAGIVQIAKKNKIPVLLIEKKKFELTGYSDELKQYNISFIVLAGFLWKIPSNLIQIFQGKIINIHPALLPAYGGKGMYGHAVHQAVLDAKEEQSGITIHYVDDAYDHGDTIFQARCAVDENDTAESLAKKIHELEYTFFAPQIEAVINRTFMDKNQK